jgi:hypothetical protein
MHHEQLKSMENLDEGLENHGFLPREDTLDHYSACTACQYMLVGNEKQKEDRR